jgi:NADP-dependent 3-hydroxy acid dehydrogenase YdfG
MGSRIGERIAEVFVAEGAKVVGAARKGDFLQGVRVVLPLELLGFKPGNHARLC